MDAIDREALTSLTTMFEALMPPVSAPQLPLRVAVDPLGSGPAGIGGVIAISAAPPGEIRARRLRAAARVRVETTDEVGIDAAVTGVTAAVLAGDRAQQRTQGLLGAELVEIGPQETVDVNGGGTRFGRDVKFRLLYEYVQAPTEAGDVISEIEATVADEPVVIEDPPAPIALRRLAAPARPSFEVVDDPRATHDRPSAWRFDDASRRFVQTSAIWGGVRTRSPNKPGTYLILDEPSLADIRVEAEIGAQGAGAVGLVFRWQDVENFYFLLLAGQPRYRLLARKRAGAFGTIAVRDGVGFEPGATHRVTLTAGGARLAASIDGGEPLAGEDRALPGPGRVGFMTHNEAGGFFSIQTATPIGGGS